MDELKVLILMMRSLSIWTCKANKSNQLEFKWKKSSLMLPIDFRVNNSKIAAPIKSFTHRHYKNRFQIV